MTRLDRWTDEDAWNRFVTTSPQGSVFSTTSFLGALGVEYDLWHLEDEATGGIGAVVLKDAAGRPVQAPFAFSLYQGPMLGSGYDALPLHRRAHEGLRLVSALVEQLEQRYDRISFCLHYDFPDIRGFSWFHHDRPRDGQFRTGVFYTGVIDLNRWSTFDIYLGAVRPNRRQEYRKALEAGLRAEETSDLDLLKTLYCATFARQGLAVDQSTLCRLLRIARASLASGSGDLLVCRTRSGEPMSASLFLRDARCAYYLVGANAPVHRKSGSGTLMLLEQIRRCYSGGIARVDMVGINSPQRGAFKTSFNARPTPYFVTSWERP
jgi:hypothetical protein